MTRYTDTFNRWPSTIGLGRIPDGPSWQTLAGSVRCDGVKAVWTATDFGIVVADFDEASFQINIDASGGDAIYARVVDSANWLRCRVRKFASWAGETPHELIIEQSVNGSVTRLASRTIYNYGGSLRFRGKGTALGVYTTTSGTPWPSGPTLTANSTVHLTAPFHGFGRAPSDIVDDYYVYGFSYDSLNTAPNAPTLLFPPNGATLDLNSQVAWQWRFNDDDPGDHQSRFETRWRQAGTSAWLQTSLNNYATQAVFTPARNFAEGGWEWQVRTWDSGGLVSPWSSSRFATFAEVDAPAILSPASGTTVDQDSVQVTWSAAEQSWYEVRTVPGLNESEPDVAASPYYTTGAVSSLATRSHTVPLPENNRSEWIIVRTGVGSSSSIVWSDWGSVRVDVAYTPPAVPALRISTNEASGSIIVTAIHRPPTGDEPDVASVRLHRRPVGDTSMGEAIPASYRPTSFDAAPTTAIVDYLPASGVEYEYRVEARGVNESSSFTAWLTGQAGFSTYGTAVYGQSTFVGGE